MALVKVKGVWGASTLPPSNNVGNLENNAFKITGFPPYSLAGSNIGCWNTENGR